MKKTSKKKSQKPLRQYHFLIRWWVGFWRALKSWWQRQVKRRRDLVGRRPHKSLFLTRRRDAARSFKIAGYIRFSREVWRAIWQSKGIFIRFIILYSILWLLIVGTLGQANYLSIRDSITSVSESMGIGELMSIFASTITSSGSEDATIASQTITGLLFLF
ncbi:MAG: hypothetical protein LBU20_01045, partial [Candidatus Nomurabacteria bacterium]|nr:hypothetical protein [Candidatus Nomurabacteria bacterium]